MKKYWILLFVLSFCSANAQTFSYYSIYGNVINRKTFNPIDSALIIIKYGQSIQDTLYSNEFGDYSYRVVKLNDSEEPINLKHSKDGHLLLTLETKLGSTQKIVLDTARLIQFRTGGGSVPDPLWTKVPGLRFKTNKSKIQLVDSTKSHLQTVITELIKHDSIVIEISGHCDFSEQNIQTLSLERAQYYKAYLVDHGIHPDRLIPKGYADTRLILSKAEQNNMSDLEKKEAKKYNQRATLSLIRTDFKP